MQFFLKISSSFGVAWSQEQLFSDNNWLFFSPGNKRGVKAFLDWTTMFTEYKKNI